MQRRIMVNGGICAGWIGEREVKVNPQRQIGGQSILPILFCFTEKASEITRIKSAQ